MLSQHMTIEEYKELAKSFNEADLAIPPDTFKSSLKSGGIYSHLTVFSLPKIPGYTTGINKVLIIVDSYDYSKQKLKIERYAYDIHEAYGCEVIMEKVSNPSHTDIKTLLLNQQENLNGAILIGDLPAGWYEYEGKIISLTPLQEWPCDLYYMDLNSEWQDNDSDGVYDSQEGDIYPEIFVGRINTAKMPYFEKLYEKDLLEIYLDKNHKFWTGQSKVNKKKALIYVDSSWAIPSRRVTYYKGIEDLYGVQNYDSSTFFISPNFGRADYLNKLSNSTYEFLHFVCHSDYYGHLFSSSNTFINVFDISNTKTEAIAYNLLCCKACRWTTDQYFGDVGRSYIMNNNQSSLVLTGLTRAGGMIQSYNYYRPLGEGKCVGEALTKYLQNTLEGGSWHDIDIEWLYGLTIVGDPMVNMFHCGCKEQLTLTSYSKPDYVANKITISPTSDFKIPSNTHVVFDTKSFEIQKNFECPIGSSFEILNEGCISCQ